MDEEMNEDSGYSSSRRNSEMNKKANGSNSYPRAWEGWG
jgi:hypothetical protein